jgi:ubiquinone biosynthesis protein Coq4
MIELFGCEEFQGKELSFKKNEDLIYKLTDSLIDEEAIELIMNIGKKIPQGS